MAFADLVREPAIHLRVRRDARLGKSDDGASWVVEFADGGVQPVGPCKPEHAAANEQLTAGASLDTLRRTALTEGGVSSAIAYVIWLQRLCDWGILDLPLVDEHGVRAVMLPQQSPFVVPVLPAESPSEERQIDRFACIRRDAGAWLLEAPLNAVRFRMDDLGALDSAVVRRALGATGFLGPTHPEPKSRREARVQWSFTISCFTPITASASIETQSADSFRTSARWSRCRRCARPGRARGSRSPARPTMPAGSVSPRCWNGAARNGSTTRVVRFPWTISARSSIGPRASDPFRPSPSATSPAGHPNSTYRAGPIPVAAPATSWEIYPVVDRSEDLGSGLYHYDAANHELVRLSGRTPEVERMMQEARIATANMANPQILLAIAARFARLMWKYKAIAYSTTLRNAGVLYQTLYLAATELGLSPCGIGAGDSALFARMTGLDPMVEGTVGEFILGGPPHPDPESVFSPVNWPGAEDADA